MEKEGTDLPDTPFGLAARPITNPDTNTLLRSTFTYTSSSSNSTTTTSSSSPPPVLRQIQAAFKRHRPLESCRRCSPEPERLFPNAVPEDSDLRAKIGNIGLARSAQEEGDFAMTRHIVGTKGYMAPEYLEHGLVSPKLDVYAFGVLLTEIITGREVSTESSAELPSLEGKDDAMENLDNFVDPSLKGEYPSELAVLAVKLIDSCLQKNLSARPGMHEVIQALSTIMETDLSFEYKLSVSVDK